MNISPRKIIASIILSLLLISSCHRKSDHEKKDYGDWVYFGVYDKLTGIDPLKDVSTLSSILSDVIFNGLVGIDENGEIVPDLAKGWEWSEDKKSINFYLKEGIKFHDGFVSDASDVDFTFRQILAPLYSGSGNYDLTMVENVKVLDNQTISFGLKGISNLFLFNSIIQILPRHIFENDIGGRERFLWNPIGTGPFKVVRLSGSEAVLEANRDYFKGRPFLDGIVVKSYKNQDEVWARLLTEEVDFCFPLSPGQVDFMKNNTNIKIYSYLSPYYYLLAFNGKNPLFQSRKVRVALNQAIDRDEIIEKILNNHGRLCSGTVYPYSWAFDPELKPYSYDPATALKMIMEEGWIRDKNGILKKNGKPFEFTVLIISGENQSENLVLSIEKYLAEIGIKIKIQPVTMGELNRKYLFSKKFEAALLSFDSGIHPGYLNYRIWHSSQIQKGLNVFSYQNAEVDEDLEHVLRVGDRIEEKKYYYKFQREIFDDPPGVFLFWKEEMVPIHKRFRGIKAGPEKLFVSIPEWWVPKNEQKYKIGPN